VASYLNTGAVSGGFTRRVNFIYTVENSKSIPRPSLNGNFDKQIEPLVQDLRHISTLRGEFRLTPAAWALFEPYYTFSSHVNEFDDEASAAYATTRKFHALKLAMAISASRSDSMLVDYSDMELAILKVQECSDDLRKVFRSVGESNMAYAADRLMRLLEMKGFCSRQEIMNVMWRHVSTTELDVLLATLESGNLIEHQNRGGRSMYKAVPQP
jgi:hypothetical protein